MTRPSWDEYFMNITRVVGERGTCDRGRSGAIIVKDKKIIATGYVGSPPGFPHCDDVGHLIETVIGNYGDTVTEHCVRTLHAEENAILQCAEFGVSAKGSDLYCKMVPCFRCAMRICRVGIVRVVAEYRYHTDERTLEYFEKAKIELVVLNNEELKYD